MSASVCPFCGNELTLEVKPDESYYLRSIEVLKKPDTRFKGESYRYRCQHCNRTGTAVHRDNHPDLLGHVKTQAEAQNIALWMYEDNPI